MVRYPMDKELIQKGADLHAMTKTRGWETFSDELEERLSICDVWLHNPSIPAESLLRWNAQHRALTAIRDWMWDTIALAEKELKDSTDLPTTPNAQGSA
jgi:hypothetical protein